MDGLALREQVGLLAASCLRRVQELQRAGSRAGGEAQAYVHLRGACAGGGAPGLGGLGCAACSVCRLLLQVAAARVRYVACGRAAAASVGARLVQRARSKRVGRPMRRSVQAMFHLTAPETSPLCMPPCCQLAAHRGWWRPCAHLLCRGDVGWQRDVQRLAKRLQQKRSHSRRQCRRLARATHWPGPAPQLHAPQAGSF